MAPEQTSALPDHSCVDTFVVNYTSENKCIYIISL